MEHKSLKVLRAERNLSQETVATALGISSATYSNWEQHPAKLPLPKLAMLADYFGVQIGEIFLPGYENLIPIKGMDEREK